jgi:hypothetical protein
METTAATKSKHHASNRFCGTCDRWHCHCNGCNWIWYGACTFSEAMRHIRLHQLDKNYFESQPQLIHP